MTGGDLVLRFVAKVLVPAPVGGTRYRPHWTDSWLPDARALARSREALYEVGGLLVARLDGGR